METEERTKDRENDVLNLMTVLKCALLALKKNAHLRVVVC